MSTPAFGVGTYRLQGQVVIDSVRNALDLGYRLVDTAQIYDCFTYMVLTQLEDYGFCKKGEGGAFVSSGALRLGGVQLSFQGQLVAELFVLGGAGVDGVLQVQVVHAVLRRMIRTPSEWLIAVQSERM